MVKFEIIDIEQSKTSFMVEVELEDRSRRRFGYPLGSGWEEEINKEPKFIMDIRKKLQNEANLIKAKKGTVEKLKKKLANKKFKIKDDN